MLKLILSFTLIAFNFQVSGQIIRSQILEAVRRGENPALEMRVKDDAYTTKLLRELVMVSSDTSAAVRGWCYWNLYQVSIKASLNHRQVATESLINGLRDSDSNNAHSAFSLLTRYSRVDFTNESITKLSGIIYARMGLLPVLAKLVGFLAIDSFRAELIALSTSQTISKRDRWNVNLALSRLGDEEASRKVVARVAKLTLNDDVVEEVFPDLIYTRQPVVFDYLISVMNSDEKKCSSPNMDNPAPILCGYRVMEMLAPTVEGFPLRTDASGDLAVRDYEKALTECREWFVSKKANYQIKRDRF